MTLDFNSTKDFVELALCSTFKNCKVATVRYDDLWAFHLGDLELSYRVRERRWVVSRLVFREVYSPIKDFGSLLPAMKLFSRMFCDYRLSRVLEEEITSC